MLARNANTQEQVFEFIQLFIAKNGYPPSVREISKAADMSTAGTHSVIRQLLNGGYISLQPGKPRTLRILKPMENG